MKRAGNRGVGICFRLSDGSPRAALESLVIHSQWRKSTRLSRQREYLGPDYVRNRWRLLAAIVIDHESRGARALVDSIANCGGGGLSGASPGLAMSAASCRGLVYRVPPGPRADRGGEMLNCSTCVYLPLFFLAA